MDRFLEKVAMDEELSDNSKRIFQPINSFIECANKYIEVFAITRIEKDILLRICRKLDEQRENAYTLTPHELGDIINESVGSLVDLFNIPMFQDFLNKGMLPTIKAQMRKLSSASSDDENALKKLALLTKIASEIENAVPSTQIILYDISEKVKNYD